MVSALVTLAGQLTRPSVGLHRFGPREQRRKQAGPFMAPLKEEESLEAKIRQDQLADLRAGLFVSMPISAILSGLICAVQALSGGGFAAASWFLVVNALNAARLALARFQLKETGRHQDLLGVLPRLRMFGVLALLAGFAWPSRPC
ncbi:hypothetical protein NKH52_28250 [Mesorhizobium sp. M1066]|uniref:Uncharacterized protein n=1 Tax=Mesorhizobium opportunistum TaxID=593909 RepID=A0ABV1YB06_9HYPH